MDICTIIFVGNVTVTTMLMYATLLLESAPPMYPCQNWYQSRCLSPTTVTSTQRDVRRTRLLITAGWCFFQLHPQDWNRFSAILKNHVSHRNTDNIRNNKTGFNLFLIFHFNIHGNMSIIRWDK